MLNLAARLSLDTSRFASQMQNAQRAIRSASSGTSQLNSVLNLTGERMNSISNRSRSAADSIKGLATGVMAAVGAQKLFNATVGEAAKMEMEKVSLNALFKDNQKAASEFFNYLNDASKNSFFEQKDFLSTGKAFVPIMKSVKDLEYVTKLTERLGASNPLEGMTGAAFSIREALSGDMTSLAERFNLPKSNLKNIKEASSMTGKLQALDKVLSNMGYTQNYMNQVNTTAYARWLKLKDTISLAMQDIGKAALDKAKPSIDMLTNALSGKEFDTFKNKAASAFASLFGGLTKGVQAIYQHRAEIANFATSVISAMQTVGSIVGKVAGFIIQHWDGVSSIILGVAAATVTFKIAMGGLLVIQTITKMVMGLRTAYLLMTGAQIALNAAMRANIIGAIITAISLLIGAGVMLYKNWDKVKAVWNSVWDSIKSAAAKGVNSVIDGINTLISQINKIPGVNFPLVAHVKWDNGVTVPKGTRLGTRSVTDKITVSKPKQTSPVRADYYSNLINGSHAGGLNRVPFDGYVARLHKDERVLTRNEADNYRNNNSRPIIIQGGITLHGVGGDLEGAANKLLDIMAYKIQAAGRNGA